MATSVPFAKNCVNMQEPFRFQVGDLAWGNNTSVYKLIPGIVTKSNDYAFTVMWTIDGEPHETTGYPAASASKYTLEAAKARIPYEG